MIYSETKVLEKISKWEKELNEALEIVESICGSLGEEWPVSYIKVLRRVVGIPTIKTLAFPSRMIVNNIVRRIAWNDIGGECTYYKNRFCMLEFIACHEMELDITVGNAYYRMTNSSAVKFEKKEKKDETIEDWKNEDIQEMVDGATADVHTVILKLLKYRWLVDPIWLKNE